MRSDSQETSGAAPGRMAATKRTLPVLCSVKTVAEALELSEKTVRKLEAAGAFAGSIEFPGGDLRIRAAAVNAYLAKLEQLREYERSKHSEHGRRAVSSREQRQLGQGKGLHTSGVIDAEVVTS